jgi:hypothetical protein
VKGFVVVSSQVNQDLKCQQTVAVKVALQVTLIVLLYSIYLCVQKRGDWNPVTEYRGFGVYIIHERNRGGRKMFIARKKNVDFAGAQQLLKPLL